MINEEFLFDDKSTKEILNSLPQDIIYQDINHRIIWANRELVDNHGSIEEIIGDHCYRVKYGRDKPCKNCLVDKVKKTKKSEMEEIIRPDGKTLLVKAYPIKDKQGNISVITEITMDITERKKEEKKYRELSKQYKYLFENSGDTAMFVTAFYGLFDFKKKVFKYSNAAHNPTLYWSAKKQENFLLDKTGVLCGVKSDYQYSCYELHFHKDDIFLFYTDGLVDRRNLKDERFKIVIAGGLSTFYQDCYKKYKSRSCRYFKFIRGLLVIKKLLMSFKGVQVHMVVFFCINLWYN